jgi:hypothetical protein
VTSSHGGAGARWHDAIGPVVVLGVSLVARALTAAAITFPIPEGSAYYVAAARNLATGRGLTVDVVWSYATPPLEVPRPAFDLWQPLASLLAAPVMAAVGPSLAAAQATSVLLGALAAVAAWAIAREAALEAGLAPSRAAGVALAAGLAVAVTPLLVIQGAEPDSSAPFTVLALAVCWLAPRALAERPPALRSRALLGTAFGLAYLARAEAIYLAIGYVGLAWLSGRGKGLRRALPVLLPAAMIGGAWLVRQAATWPVSPLGQLLENAWSVQATDIFAWSYRPTLASYLALGLPGLASLRLEGIAGNAALVLLTAFPVAILGLATVVVWPRLAATPALRLLGVGAVLTMIVDSLAFPVASRAGLYAHGAGPTIVLLAVLAALGLDGLVARVATLRRWRWQPASGSVAPLVLLPTTVLVALALPLAVLSATLEHERSTELGAEYEALAAFSTEWAVPRHGPLVSDHPMWVNAALDRTTVVLPREAPAAIADVARHFGAAIVIVRDADSGDVAAGLTAYRGPSGEACFRPLPAPPPFIALAFTCLGP